MEDRKLIRLIKRNPEKGISIALDIYGDPVKTICSDILRGANPQDIEEAIADTFVRLWRYSGSFDSGRGTSLQSYIYGIARNAAIDKRKDLFGADFSADWVAELTIPDDDLDVEDFIVKREEELLVRQVLSEMDEPERSIFILRYFRDFRVKEIAAALGLTDKQVENKLHRTKAALKAKLEEKGVR